MDQHESKSKQTQDRLLPFNWNEVRSQCNPGEEHKIGHIPPVLLPAVLQPESVQHQHSITNQSELSIGNKTAEQLVGDILASGEHSQNSQEEIKLEQVLVIPESTGLHRELRVDKIQPTLGVQNAMHMSDQIRSEVLSPSRLLSSEHDVTGEQQPGDEAAFENPFEMAQNEKLIIDEDTLLKDVQLADNGKKSEPNLNTAQEKDAHKQMMKTEQEETKDHAPGNETQRISEQTFNPLGLSKQRSNSASNLDQKSGTEKKARRRKLLQKITLFGQKVSETVGGSQQQPQNSQDHQDNAEKLVAASNTQDGRASVTQTKEKKSIISKLFSRKDKDQLVEESKTTSIISGPPAPLSPQGKAGVKSRFVNFFKKTSKFTKKQSDSQIEPANEIAVQEEEKQHEVVLEKVVQLVEPESSLDTGFRANIADSYGLDDDQDERVHFENNSNSGQLEAASAIPSNQDQDQDDTDSERNDDDEETDVEDESEDTNDEIFSAHEGLDFRPTQAGLFSFPETAEGQQRQRLSNQSSSNNQRQSLPMSSQSSGENSQQATGGCSVGSLEDQQHQQTQFQPPRRAQSQCAEDLTVVRQQTTDGDEWEVSFGQPLNEGNHSPTDLQLLPPQQHFSAANNAHLAPGQHIMPQIQNRISAGFLGQSRSSLLGAPINNMLATDQMAGGNNSITAAGNAANCDPFVPSEATQIGEFGRVIYDKDSVKRSTSFQNTQNKVAQFFSHLQQSQNNNQPNVSDASNLQTPPFQQQQHQQYHHHHPQQPLRISEPFMPSSYVHEQQYHVQKQVHSLGAIQQHYGQESNTPFQGLQQNACPFGQTPQYTYKGLKPYQGGYNDYSNKSHQQYKNQNFGPNNISGSKNTQLENPYKRQSTPNQMYGFENGRESLTTSRGGLSHSSSSRSGFQRNNPPRPTRCPKSQYNLSDRNSQNAQTSNNTKDKHQTTPNQDDNDSNTCSSLSGLANNKRKRRTRKRGGTSEKLNAEGTAESVVSGDGQIVPTIQCYCCSSGAINCLLEAKIDDFNHLPAIERIKSLILADQQLLHFQPIDTRKTGGSAQNCARAGIEGKIKDDIWHECCPCCESVRNTLLSEMKGIASELCRDQLCSKFIQVQLSRCPVTEQAVIDAFYAEIIKDEELLFLQTQQASRDKALSDPEPQITKTNPAEMIMIQMSQSGEKLHETSLMKNVFGNYVIQLLFEKGSKEQIDQFYQCMLQQCYKLANDSFGCRILQKALVFLPLDQQLEIVQKFQFCKLFEMMLSEEGNYIIQCIIYSVPAEHIQFFLPVIEQRLIQLCRDKRGCRIIQRTLEKFPHEDIQHLINEIIKNANDLTPQSYGNYVITHILNNGIESDRNKIIESIMGNMIHFSLYQLGSNVVENCLRMAPDDLKEEILKRVDALPLTTTFENPQISLSMLLENQFGNYVIQHAFHLADEARKRKLRDRINQAADEGFVVRSNNYAKHVYTLMHAHFISECADCASRAKNEPPQAIEVPTLAEKYSRSAQIQRNLEFRMKAGEKIIQTESVVTQAAKMEQNKQEKKEGVQKKSKSGSQRRKAKEQANLAQKLKQETPAEEEKELSLQTGIDQTKITNSAAETGGSKDDQQSNEDNRGKDDDDDRSQNSQDDKFLGPDGEKKKRRRRRKRKAKKGGICQEDVLEALSDSDREEFLANQQVLLPGQVNSLFVLDPQSASRKRHSKTTREFVIDGEESSEIITKQEMEGLITAKQVGADQGELSASESNNDEGLEESKD